MNLNDIFRRILVRSGQYILKTKNIEIDVDTFSVLVEDALEIYNNSVPFEKLYHEQIYYPRQLVMDDNYDPEMKRAPNWLSEVNPVRIYGAGYNAVLFGNYVPSGVAELSDPIQAPWNYEKPVLTVPYSAKYNIRAVYHHIVEELEELDSNDQRMLGVKTISIADSGLFMLLQSYFLQGIGKSRRAFTMSDLPIVMDAEVLVSDGETLE
ncbi:hypothetical protein KAR91_22820, partial [Candidatus Pacearchaeota archaeon]|nr:hypothetical protein [Candidatus Pacearchaeota archaeon]